MVIKNSLAYLLQFFNKKRRIPYHQREFPTILRPHFSHHNNQIEEENFVPLNSLSLHTLLKHHKLVCARPTSSDRTLLRNNIFTHVLPTRYALGVCVCARSPAFAPTLTHCTSQHKNNTRENDSAFAVALVEEYQS